LLGAVVAALIAGADERAERLLAPIARQTRLSHPIALVPTYEHWLSASSGVRQAVT
jgi:hypothetical protein